MKLGGRGRQRQQGQRARVIVSPFELLDPAMPEATAWSYEQVTVGAS
jgi:hypothetical protein